MKHLWFHTSVYVVSACSLTSVSDADIFTGVGFLPGTTRTWATDLSADGQVVIGESQESLSVAPRDAWKWSPHTGIGALPMDPNAPSHAIAGGLSYDGGVMVGSAINAPPPNRRGLRWTGAGVTTFDLNVSDARLGLSSDGLIAVGSTGQSNPAIWRIGQPRQLIEPVINAPFGAPTQATGHAFAASSDGTRVVGVITAYDRPPGDFRQVISIPFVWTPATGTTALLNNGLLLQGAATDTSEDGIAVVGTASNGSQVFRWTVAAGYTFVQVTSFPGVPKVSGDGRTVIFGDTYWDLDRGVLPLTQVLTEAGCDFSGWTITAATGISFDGRTLCGEGIDPTGHRQGWYATVPAPSATALLLTAVAVLRRRRR